MRILLAAALALLCACGGGSAAPKNWSALAGQRNAWTNGRGSEYRYDAAPFSGTLSDLASQVAIDALTKNRGAKLQSSNPFPACPGAAGLATFRLDGRGLLAEGFAVRDNQAVRTHYLRPATAGADPDVLQAMQSVLCKPPA
jgi:hypothetical protein